jgi:hypothetical protein
MDKPIILSRVFGIKPSKQCCCCESRLGLIVYTIIAITLGTIVTLIQLGSKGPPLIPDCFSVNDVKVIIFCFPKLPETLEKTWNIINALGTFILRALVLHGYFKKNVKILKLGYYIYFILCYTADLLSIWRIILIIEDANVQTSVLCALLIAWWLASILFFDYMLLLILSTIEHVKGIQDVHHVNQVHPTINGPLL